MKKLLIVNNNMQLGGVQKALISLLHEIKDQYDITLFLFSPNGPCFADIPKEVKVVAAKSWYRCFGVSQAESKESLWLHICRTALAVGTKLFGRTAAVALANLSQSMLKERYDVAVSYLHNGGPNSFYGGCNDFVLHKVRADKKVTFLHGDYTLCGANHPRNNADYRKFDLVAACSDGCRQSLVSVLPDMAERCVVVPNCHDYGAILEKGIVDPVMYGEDVIHIVSVARLSKEKGLERALKAVSECKRQGIRLRYHVIGNGIERERLFDLTEQLEIGNCVTFYGDQKNPYRYFPKADLLLISSYHEAAPLVIDEARCFGVPVLSTRTSSAEEMIAARQLGWVCDNTQEALTEALMKLLCQLTLLRERKEKILRMDCNNSEAVSAFKKIIK